MSQVTLEFFPSFSIINPYPPYTVNHKKVYRQGTRSDHTMKDLTVLPKMIYCIIKIKPLIMIAEEGQNSMFHVKPACALLFSLKKSVKCLHILSI